MTADEFQTAVLLDPSWASKLTEPVEITGYCEMGKSNITHLSALLHFTGINGLGECASFSRCKNLKVAEGTFEGYVTFSNSNVEKIGKIKTKANVNGVASSFYGCENLKIAEGDFKGYVDFSNSDIESIGRLMLLPNNNGTLASFAGCNKLILNKDWLDKKIIMDCYLKKRSEDYHKIKEVLRSQPELEI